MLPRTIPIYWQDQVIQMVTNTLRPANTPPGILLWVTLARDCLISMGQKLSDGRNWSQYSDMMWYARGELTSLAGLINERMSKWGNDAQGDHVADNIKDITTQPPTPAESAPGKNGENRGGRLDSTATQKALEEWRQIQDIVEELLPGLNRGYIMPTVSERYTRFPRDPEGFCSHIDAFCPQDTSVEPILVEEVELLFRDPDGLCSRSSRKGQITCYSKI